METLFQVSDFVFPPPPLEDDLSEYYVAVQGSNGMTVTYSITNIWSIGYTATIEVSVLVAVPSLCNGYDEAFFPFPLFSLASNFQK